MEKIDSSSFEGFGVNNEVGVDILNNGMSGMSNNSHQKHISYYGGASNITHNENAQQFHLTPGMINNANHNSNNLCAGLIHNSDLFPGVNNLFTQQLLTGNTSMHPFIFNGYLNSPILTSFVTPSSGINKDGFASGIEGRDSGINAVLEDEDKTGRLKAAAAAQMIINEVNKTHSQKQPIHESGTTEKNCGIVTEDHHVQHGGVKINDSNVSFLGVSNQMGNSCNNSGNNLPITSSPSPMEDAGTGISYTFGHGGAGNGMAIATPFGLLPLVSKFGNQYRQFQDQVQTQNYYQLLQEQLHQIQKHTHCLQANQHNFGSFVSGDQTIGSAVTSGDTSSINGDVNFQIIESGDKQAVRNVNEAEIKNKEEKVVSDIENSFIQQQQHIQQMMMLMGGIGVGLSNPIFGGIQNTIQSQQSIYHQMQLYSIIQHQQMLHRQQQINQGGVGLGIGTVSSSGCSIPIKGFQTTKNVQNTFGATQQQVNNNGGKVAGTDFQFTRGFSQSVAGNNSGIRDPASSGVLNGVGLINQTNIDSLNQFKYGEGSEKNSKERKTDYYDPAIGDELRAVLGLSASAIRGIKTNKNGQDKVVVSTLNMENNVPSIRGSSCDVNKFSNSVGGGTTVGLGGNDSQFIKSQELVDFPLRMGSEERRQTTQNSRKVHRKISSRGISKNSSKLQASNLLSIIESEQLSKTGENIYEYVNLKNAVKNVDVTKDGVSMAVCSDKTASSNSLSFSASPNYNKNCANSEITVSPDELNRIEYLNFTVETIPSLVKDYVPSFSGKFAFVPLPPMYDNIGNGSYTNNNGKNGVSNSSSSVSTSLYFNRPYKSDVETGTNTKKIIQGLRSRRNKIVSNGNNMDDSNLNNSNANSSKNVCSFLIYNKLTEQNRSNISSKLPKFLLSVLKSIRLLRSKDELCSVKDLIGLKMVAKEKLTCWMDMPFDIDRKKARTGLGPNTRESLRKELKKQGELFRLVSTKDEFLCDTKMINNYNSKHNYCLNSNTGNNCTETNPFNNCINIKAESEQEFLNCNNPLLIKHNCSESTKDDNNGVNFNIASNFTQCSTEMKGIISTSVSSSTIGANSPTRWTSNSMSGTDNSDLSGNRCSSVNNNEFSHVSGNH